MTQFLERPSGERVAYLQQPGKGPGIVWVGGFRSNMNGTKAEALASWAARTGRSVTRFDYTGHGQSSGDFRAGTISRWRDDALAVLDGLTEGPQVLVGSSMGGWISTLLAHARPERIAGMVLIAPAPDFTEELMWAKMPPELRRAIAETGVWMHVPENGEAFPITRDLIEDGRTNLVLNRVLQAGWPVRILHGLADRDVPWQHGFKLVDAIDGDVRVTLVKGADHRLSTPADLALIERTVETILQEIGA